MNNLNGTETHHRNVVPPRMEESIRLQNSINARLSQRNLRDRINESLPAVVIGTLLVLSGAILLFWNEDNAVTTTRSLDEGYKAVVKVPSNDAIDDSNEDKLIHIWGHLSITSHLQDQKFEVQVKSVQLKRRVQIYQWIEEETTFATGDPAASSDTSYSYSQMWKDKLVDSSSFYIPWGHENPKSIPIPTTVQTAELAKVGAYVLSPAIKEMFTNFIPFAGDEPVHIEGHQRLHNGMYYLTKDIFNLETGDIRIQFYFAGHDGDMVTIIGRQVGDSVHPYVTSSGKELLIMRPGKLSTEEMFSSKHAQNRILTWFIRMAGWFLLFLGMTCVSSIIEYLVVFSPLLRDVIHLGLGSANLTLSMSLSLMLIGGAWCFYRPWLAIFILFVASLPMIRALFTSRIRRSRTL